MALLVETADLVKGSDRVAQLRDARRSHLRAVLAEAERLIETAGESGVAEADVIRAVMAAVPTDQATAAAAVDRVKVLGNAVKDMRTGRVQALLSSTS